MPIRVLIVLLCSMLFLSQTVLSEEISTSGKHSAVFLFDVSESVKKSDRENYFNNLQQVLNSLSPGDDFIALKIGKDSQLLKPIASGTLPVREKGMASGYYESEKKKVVNGAIVSVGKFLKNTTDERTSIISSFVAANDYLAGRKGTRKYIFVCSDMMEASSFLNMELGGEFAVKKYIHLDPNNMEGAGVYVLGVNTGEKSFEKVKKFWTGFLNQYNAKIVYYQYSLTNFTLE